MSQSATNAVQAAAAGDAQVPRHLMSWKNPVAGSHSGSGSRTHSPVASYGMQAASAPGQSPLGSENTNQQCQKSPGPGQLFASGLTAAACMPWSLIQGLYLSLQCPSTFVLGSASASVDPLWQSDPPRQSLVHRPAMKQPAPNPEPSCR